MLCCLLLRLLQTEDGLGLKAQTVAETYNGK